MKCWRHFSHQADIGVHGEGATLEEAFEQAGLALTAVVTDPATVLAETVVNIECSAPNLELLFVDWLNAVIYEMATRNMLFSDFKVSIEDLRLKACIRGECVNVKKHYPAVEIKGATYTELKVAETPQGWLAECVVDV